MAEVQKKRISSLAKSYEIPSDLLVKFLKEAGHPVKSAMSMIDQKTFLSVKPKVVAEKERNEREALVKSGKKIPMKAVLKKSPRGVPPNHASKLGKIVLKKSTSEPRTVTAQGPLFRKPETSSPVASSQATASPVTAPKPAPEVVQKAAKAPEVESPKVESKPSEVTASATAASSPAQAESKKEESAKVDPQKATANASEAQLRVSVEKPNAEVLARIQKSQAARSHGYRGGRQNQGYSGSLGRQRQGGGGFQGKFTPGGPNRGGNHSDQGPRRPTTHSGSLDAPRDVYEVRALQAGITGASPFGLKPPAGGGKDQKDRAHGGGGGDQQRQRRGRGRRKSREQVEQELAQTRQNVSKVMASLSRSKSPKLKQKKESQEEEIEEKKTLEVGEYITIGELAGLMNVMPNQVIAKCMELGLMVTINQRLDHETIALIADEFGFSVSLMEEYEEETLSEEPEEVDGEMTPRAPIVTIMGHVDHGKTSILDHIRKTNVIAGEAGGITQHIGAYLVETETGPICFLDTPGHEAFSAMRSRGANVTDVVVLVVAADSMVMPQTKESINLAKNANTQIVVAINKVDLPTANPDKIRSQLADNGIDVEDWGGKYPCVEVSAQTGQGIDKLLETLALETEVMELKANQSRRAQGTVLESRLDKGMGAVATILVQNGTLEVGDPFVTGTFSGRVRAMMDERGRARTTAGPSTPVQVLGTDGTPQAGDSFTVVNDDREAREVATRRSLAAKDRELRQKRHITLDQLYDQIKSGEFHELNVIIKGDVDGSVEAIAAALERLSTPEVKVNVISKGVGTVTAGDIHLAATANALVIGFHVLAPEAVRILAEEEGVTINNYRVIYEIVEEVKGSMEGLLSPEIKEEVAGEAVIKQLFKIPKVGVIAGCMVQSGTVDMDAKVRLYREGIEVSETKVTSLKRNKDSVKSVKAGFECGIGLHVIKDIQEGDTLAFFKKVEIARKLSTASSGA